MRRDKRLRWGCGTPGLDDLPPLQQRSDLRADLGGVAWRGGGGRGGRRGVRRDLGLQERADVALLVEERQLARLEGELGEAGELLQLGEALDDGRARLAVHAPGAPRRDARALQGARRHAQREQLGALLLLRGDGGGVFRRGLHALGG